jgi:glycerol-3-phosphate dehydrogenase
MAGGAVMDYRELLKRYLAHIIDIEGFDFLTVHAHNVELTEEERRELSVLSDEAKTEYPL